MNPILSVAFILYVVQLAVGTSGSDLLDRDLDGRILLLGLQGYQIS